MCVCRTIGPLVFLFTVRLMKLYYFSRDGFSRSGVYCTLSICCEQLESEREVDVFNAVRLVKQNRPQLVPTLVSNGYKTQAVNGTSCTPLGTQILGVGLGLVAPVSV